MSGIDHIHIHQAIQDFRSARQKAVLREVIARFKGESLELLPFDEVRQKLKAQIGAKKVLKEIPIASIIGSVNRYQDFTRDFLPGKNIVEERWAKIEVADQGLEGLPPIEAYQMGDVYFVSDGNHRVSVAKQLGAKEIQAYVTEVRSRVPLTADIRPEELILKFEYADFLENTNLDKLRPEADLSVTVPGQYQIIEEHIAVHHYYMGIEQQHDISPSDAAADWYDNVYLPVISIIRDHSLLIDFPDRTEADLYLWIAEHKAALEENLKSEVAIGSAADDLAHQFSQRTNRVISRIGNRITRAIIPQALEAGTVANEGQEPIPPTDRDDHLFHEILVPINGEQDGWFAVQQALVIAQRENSRIHGLYVLESAADKDASLTHEVQEEFARRCNHSGIQFDFSIKIGDITQNICTSSRDNDLVVLNLTYPPEPSALTRLSSGIRNFIRCCPRPILFTPKVTRPLDHALLAYDGSPQSHEALYLATYLSGQWDISLHVLSIGDKTSISKVQADARRYLEDHKIQAEYITSKVPKDLESVIQAVQTYNIDLVIIGGYNRNPVIEFMQGGEVDAVLRQTPVPILICR